MPAQTPAVQTSFLVHALPSLHLVPLSIAGVEQVPFVVSQVPATWQASLGEQETGLLPTQVPEALHRSVRVHAFPSLHVACCSQPPVPSHFPVFPHVVFALAQVVVLGRGSAPTGMLEQVPTRLVRVQLWQAPAQELLQHTLSIH